MQRVEHIAQINTHGHALVAVDVEVKPRGVGAGAGEQAGEPLGLVALRDDRIAHLLQGRKPQRAAVFHHHLEAAGIAQPVDGGRPKDAHTGLAHLFAQPLAQRDGDVVAREAATLFKGLEDHIQRAIVRGVGAQQQRLARDGDRVAHPLGGPGDGLNFAHHSLGALHAGAVGQLHIQQQVAFVLGRDEAGGGMGEAPVGAIEQAHIHHQHQQADSQEASYNAGVHPGGEIKGGVEQLEEPAQGDIHQPGERVAFGAVRLEQDGREGGRQGERVEGRDHRGDGDGDGELAEELAGDTADEGARHKHRAQHQRHRDDRAGHLVHRLAGRVARGVALGQPALDILHHHDGVVDHDANGQHQAEQRQVVQAEAHGGHGGEGAHNSHRHGNERDDGGAPVLQEDEHHNRHQSDGVAQGLEHLDNRFLDERRGVVNDFIIQPLGEALFQLVHLVIHTLGGGQGVGAGQLEDGQRHRGLAVEGARLIVLLGPQLQPGDVAQADDPLGVAFLARGDDGPAHFHHHIAELLGVGQAAQGVDDELELLACGHGLLADGAGGHLQVLLAQRHHHLVGGQAQAGHFLGVEPGAHGVVALAHEGDIAHAGQAEQLVTDLDGGVVA